MSQPLSPKDVKAVAYEFDAEIRALSVRNSPNVRKIRRRYSRLLKGYSPDFILDLVRTLILDYGYRGPAYELLASHRAAFERLGEAEVEALGHGINSWWAVDSFARLLAGPAWLQGLIADELITRWALSTDHWWRRAALVSTVALNVRSHGGAGDTPRTLAVCRLLADDPEDMVVKALSWALRELVVHDPQAVEAFLQKHEGDLAARVKREVRNKLTTGLKNPKGAKR
jgi:3-methyladenine DNA glycosylase AlkD